MNRLRRGVRVRRAVCGLHGSERQQFACPHQCGARPGES